MTTDERVFCLQRTELEALLRSSLPQGGFTGVPLAGLLQLAQHFLPRSLAEHEPAFKQLIPYQLFRREDRYFVYQRGQKVGENRLAGRCSLGIGGHINSNDAPTGKLTEAGYFEALRRERQEELLCPDSLGTVFVGLINDDTDQVGRVHLGAVHLCRVSAGETLAIRPHSEDLHARGWWMAEEIFADKDRFEKWSLLALELALRETAKMCDC